MSIVKQVCILVVTFSEKKVDFTFNLHRGLWAVFNLSMLSWQEVTEAWKTVQDQLWEGAFVLIQF